MKHLLAWFSAAMCWTCVKPIEFCPYGGNHPDFGGDAR